MVSLNDVHLIGFGYVNLCSSSSCSNNVMMGHSSSVVVENLNLLAVDKIPVGEHTGYSTDA